MDVSSIYDAYVAHRFDEDPFDLYAECRELALAQIREKVPDPLRRVMDLGCGTGDFLSAMAALFPTAAFWGIDGSQKMLEIARAKLDQGGASRAVLIRDDVLNLGEHVGPDQIDLLALHFVMTRVDNQRLLKGVHRALRPGGWCSIATATYESFPVLRKLASTFLSEQFIRSSSSIPENRQELREILKRAGFEILEESVLRKKVSWTDIDQFRDFVLHSGWFPHPVIMNLKDGDIEHYRELCLPFLPIEDTAEKNVVLARKIPGASSPD